MLKTLSIAALCTSVCVGAVQAQTTPSIGQRVATASAPFETGTYQALAAIERLAQGLNHHQITDGFAEVLGLRLGAASVAPEPPAPDTFITLIKAFAGDLEAARRTLSQTDPAQAQAFVLDVGAVWFDINGNAQIDEGERGTQVLATVLPRNRRFDLSEGPHEVRFDGADHAWLMAYTHVLSAAAEAILAFDPTPVFADLIEARANLATLPTVPNTFDMAAIKAEIAERQAELDAITAQITAITDQLRTLREAQSALEQQLQDTETRPERDRLQTEITRLASDIRALRFRPNQLWQEQRFLQRYIISLEAKLPNRPRSDLEQVFDQPDIRNGVDALYAVFKVLQQPPKAAHIAKLETHLRAMLDHNRIFWDEVAQETDNDREWIPNPSQTNAFGLTVPVEMATAWQSVLADGAAVLDGRILVAHPLAPAGTGINVNAWFENPSALDPVGWIHGRDAYPYLARGPQITGDTWIALQRATGGNAFAFALFFN